MIFQPCRATVSTWSFRTPGRDSESVSQGQQLVTQEEKL